MHHAQAPLVIIPVPAFKDNYLWLIRRGDAAVVVDPGDAAPVEAALFQLGLSLDAILLTHHHSDHMGGVDALVSARSTARLSARLPALLPVYGPASEPIAGVTQPLRDGDSVTLASLGIAFDVLSVPGHTRGHIAYFRAAPDMFAHDASSLAAPLLFCGDTLFACGCGRLFEGTAARQCDVKSAGSGGDRDTRTREPTLPSTIALERPTNPFSRGSRCRSACCSKYGTRRREPDRRLRHCANGRMYSEPAGLRATTYLVVSSNARNLIESDEQTG